MNIKPFAFTVPPLTKTVIPTGFMVEIENRFKEVFFEGGFLVWYGTAGAGKTTCAEWLTARINDAFTPEDPLAFRALIYEAGRNTGRNTGKLALRTLYRYVSGYPLDSGTYRDNGIEDIAEEVFYAIKRKRLGTICVDEAGLLPLDAINALALVLDIAKREKYYLTIILIGMDNLPLKLDQEIRPQLYRRVHQWCNFKDYDLEDSYNLIAGLHPYFASIDRTIPDQWNQVRIVHELTGGLPGFIVQFLAKFDNTYRKIPNAINTVLLRGIHLNNNIEYKEIMAAAKGQKIDKEKTIMEIAQKGKTIDGKLKENEKDI